MFTFVNEVSVVVAALLSVALFHIWYSPLLFGSIWNRVSFSKGSVLDFSQKEMIRLTAISLILNIILFSVYAQWVIKNIPDVKALYSTCLAICALVFVYMMGIALWERRPLSYVFLHVGYLTLGLCAGISVIAFWPW